MADEPRADELGVAARPAEPRRAEERRTVTTLFCDLVGFTALSERNDPEVVNSFLSRYYEVARRMVESYGGTMEKFIGDAVVAVFGVPTMHEDDPERAVRAGLRLVDEVDALSGVGGQAVEVRVGINTGEALVRLDVDPASGKGFLTGDAVNVAARLQAAAPPMAVAVGEATHAATERVFAFDACHPVSLKGKSQPLKAWIATGSLARTGAELRAFGSAFVGREEDLAALDAALDDAVASRSPRFALVCGEPGIGKSRLVAEFARRLDDRPGLVRWRQGRCLPFGSNVTFWALSEIVRSSAGVLESDGVARTEARLETLLPESAGRDRLRSRLRPLLGLDAEEASREDNFASWREFMEGLAAAEPAVVVVEDLHWADEPMLAFMDDLAASKASVPLLVLATARPEMLESRGSGAGFVAAATTVPLGPLSGEETAELARDCLGAKSLPTDLHALILERSGGNPLFAEELVRLLQDRDLLEGRGGKVQLRPGVEVPTPDSIGALIAARLDLLSPERKALLADAAVVGRTFWAGAVAAVGPNDPAKVYASLHELVAKELVRPERTSSMEGETEFVFVHALVCDVAYAQLTLADRASKHAKLARWLEERTAGRPEDVAEILAYHYGTALEAAATCGLDDLEDELAEPTTRYLELAGGRAAPLDAAAAAAHFARAQKVADEAARPKRRLLLSRKARRRLRRRAPLLLAAVAAIVMAAVAAMAIYEFRPTHAATAPVKMAPGQIAAKYGPSVVRLTTRAPFAVHGELRWRSVSASGVIVSKEGLIYTSGQPLVNRSFPSWQPLDVEVEYVGDQGQYSKIDGVYVGTDPQLDIGVVKVSTERELSPIPLGDSESVRRGDHVVTLSRQGTFLAWDAGAVADIIMSTLDAPEEQETLIAMRTTTDFKKPPTGGALIDSHGQLVGVMGDFYWNSDSPGYTGDDVAVAIGLFRQAVPQALQQGTSPWLGIGYLPITPTVSQALGLGETEGCLVEFVTPGSPAEKAGIIGGHTYAQLDGKLYVLGGDVILDIDGVSLRAIDSISPILDEIGTGRAVSVHLLREGTPITVKVKLADNPRKI